MEDLSDQNGFVRKFRMGGGIYGSTEADWAGEDVCITADGGALVANDCGAFGFTKISPFLENGTSSGQ